MDQLRGYLRLHLAEGVGAVTLGRLVEALGGVEGVLNAAPGQWMRVDGVGEKTAQAIAAVTDEQVDEELALAERMGVDILTEHDDRYPEALRNLYNPPRVLYVRGRLEAHDAIAIGVVGARRCTHYGLEQAERFGQLLGRAGLTVVSGGARGIDTASHRGAMLAGGRTIAVMGCGLGHVYPPENKSLFEQIVADDCGALVSELPLRTAVLPGSFPTRNRIISGMSLAVLVIEAARRSGSLITARQAAEQGKDVFALPGRVDSPMSQGTNELIRNGSLLVQNLDDILEHLGEVGSRLSGQDDEAQGQALPPGLDAAETQLFNSLAEGPLVLDELVRRTGLSSSKVVASMTMLVLKGAVMQQAGNMFVRKPAAKTLFS
jgi:DNA processing protein